MSINVQVGESMVEVEGNTNSSTSRISAGKYWCFTYNNYSNEKLIELVDTFVKKNIKYFFTKEIGKSGTPHLQGFINSSKLIRPIECMQNKNIHWEKCRGSLEDNVNYCSKTKSEIFSNMEIKKKLEDPLLGKELYPFQKEILNIINDEPDRRSIYWFWEKNGKVGKTALAKHICLTEKYSIFLSGKGNDIKFGVSKFLEKNAYLHVAIFYYTRDYEEYVSYDALESIKDGIFYSSKYESSMCLFNSPHVIVFANFAPNSAKLSQDRWNIKEIVL